MKQTYYKSLFTHCLDFESAFNEADGLWMFQPDVQLYITPCNECGDGYWVARTELSPPEGKCPSFVRNEKDFSF